MPKTKITFKGMKKLEAALDSKQFDKIMRRNMRRATQLNGMVVQAAYRKAIQSGIKPSNAALTQAIKGDDKPLVGTSELFNAITSKVVNDFTAFAGVLRRDDVYNIALAIHEGVSIQVSQKMRNMFYLLWQASEGKIDPSELTGRPKELFEAMQNWYPLKESTNFINIPARPWMRYANDDPEMKRLLRNNWQQALKASFREQAAAARSKK